MAEEPNQAWRGLVDAMLRLLRGKDPRPPRFVHEKRIRNSMARAYYGVLNDDDAFRRALEVLLSDWTYTAAEQFALRWRLPKNGLKDLDWTHTLWSGGRLKAPHLQIGSRSYPGVEGAIDEDSARRLGYRPHPPRLKDVRSLRCGARRLYRRAVLRWPWNKIAKAEIEENDKRFEDENWPIDHKSIRDDVNRWSEALGVPLPQVPRGRPPKRSSSR